MIISKNIINKLNKIYYNKKYYIYILSILLLFIIIYLCKNKEKFGINDNISPVIYNEGVEAIWTVPPGVTSATFTVIGGKGGDSPYSKGGFGAKVVTTLYVTQESKYYIYVGKNGNAGVNNVIGTLGGISSDSNKYFNGGNTLDNGGGGGSASFVVFNSAPTIIAGGGGGAAGGNGNTAYVPLPNTNGGSGNFNLTFNGSAGNSSGSATGGKGGTGSENINILSFDRIPHLGTTGGGYGGGGGGGFNGGIGGIGGGGGAGGSFVDSTKTNLPRNYLIDTIGTPSIIIEWNNASTQPTTTQPTTTQPTTTQPTTTQPTTTQPTTTQPTTTQPTTTQPITTQPTTTQPTTTQPTTTPFNIPSNTPSNTGLNIIINNNKHNLNDIMSENEIIWSNYNLGINYENLLKKN